MPLRVLWILLVVMACPGASAIAASGMFPKMPPGTNVFVININKDSSDAWMTARAIQGIINQKSAEVYLINNPWDWDPLKDCGKPYEELPRLTGTGAGLRTLFAKYQNRVKKMFLYDPDKDWTWYLALMSGAQQDGIPVTETIKDELVSEFGWKGEVEDFRNRWSNRIAAYDWALANLIPHCTGKVIFVASGRGSPITDYAVASKGFVFWLDFTKPGELAEIQKIFHSGRYSVGTSLMGYANNGDAANEAANPFGIGYVVSVLYANGSFWSSFPDKTYKQPPGRAIKAEPGKVFAHIMWSDGDNLEFDQNPLYKFWHDPARGTIPIATQLAPALQELNSPLLDWYYSKLTTNDELVAGPTGCQFIFIRDYNDRLFPAWCNLTRIWCAGAGFRSSRIWIAPNPTAKYSQYMTMCGFEGLFGEGWSVKAGFPPKVDTYGANNEADLFNEITKIKPDPLKPVFCGFTCIVGGFYQGDHGYSAVKRVIDRVYAAYPGRYVFLLPKDEFATIRAYYNTDMPNAAGSPDSTNGLSPVFQGDGQFTTVDREGRHCWLAAASKPGSANFFYMAVPDAFRPKVGQKLEIDLAYFDEGNSTVELDYDSTDTSQILGGAYKRSPYVLHRQNSGQWKLARFFVNDAGFGHSENNSSDFRFQSDDDDLLVSGVEVQRVGLNH
jgi:hypothetical protein